MNNNTHAWVNCDGRCVFVDTCQHKEALLQEQLGNAPLPARHLPFPRSFILIVIIEVVKA